MRWIFACALVLAACADGAGPLRLGEPQDAGARSDGGSAACPSPLDRRADNRREVLELGFSLAESVLRVRVERPPALDGERVDTQAEVLEVFRGHSFLEGVRARVELEGAVARRGEFPRELLLGLTEPGLPVARDDGLPELSRVLISAELAERPMIAHHLAYAPPEGSTAAGVEIVSRTEDRVHARVLEPIAGELPERLVMNWGRAYDAPWPEPGSRRWILTVGPYGPSPLPDGSHLVQAVDVRPFTAEARRQVAAALSQPSRPFDAVALDALVETMRDSWRFHRAPRVVATEVTGLAAECCTGAGGTYVEHAVQADLRGQPYTRRVVRGGHAYYSDEACGDRRLLGLDQLLELRPESTFACDLSTAPPDTSLEVSRVLVEREDSPEARAEVQTWLRAPEPHYLLLGSAGSDFVGQPSDGPWSARRSVTEALALGALSRVRVRSATVRGDGATEIRLETAFTAAFYDHLELMEVRLVLECPDPRLTEVGAEWLLPIFGDVAHDTEDGGASGGGLFVVPGVIFEADGPVRGLAQRVRRRGR